MIVCCGEALFDVFFDGDGGGDEADGAVHLQAHVGGSPLNVAIGIARLGGNSALLTGVSRDLMGERLFRTLENESVDTGYLIRSGNRTTLSLVGVDSQGQPSYVFYGLGSADCSVTPEELPAIGAEVTGLHFGSYSLVVRPVADAFSYLLAHAGDRFISVDPNVRASVEPDLGIWRQRVHEFTARADLVKISSEDMAVLYPGVAPSDIAVRWLAAGVKLVVVTDGSEKVSAWTQQGYVVRIAPRRIDVVDTVGAGDSFQAALLAKLAVDGAGDLRAAVMALNAEKLEALIEYAVAAAAVTCGRRGADLPRHDEVTSRAFGSAE